MSNLMKLMLRKIGTYTLDDSGTRFKNWQFIKAYMESYKSQRLSKPTVDLQ